MITNATSLDQRRGELRPALIACRHQGDRQAKTGELVRGEQLLVLAVTVALRRQVGRSQNADQIARRKLAAVEQSGELVVIEDMAGFSVRTGDDDCRNGAGRPAEIGSIPRPAGGLQL